MWTVPCFCHIPVASEILISVLSCQMQEQAGKSQKIHGQHLPMAEKVFRRPFVHRDLKPEIIFNRIRLNTEISLLEQQEHSLNQYVEEAKTRYDETK